MKKLVVFAREKGKKSLVVACAQDENILKAVQKAVADDIINVILIGDENEIIKICQNNKIDYERFQIINEAEQSACLSKAVELVNNGEADILMKGLVHSEDYVKTVLNKQKGLREPDAVITHVAVMDIPLFDKLKIVSDVAIIEYPDLEQKKTQVKYLTEAAKMIGVKMPKIAAICTTEKVSPRIQSSIDAKALADMASKGEFGDVVLEGPLSFDIAMSKTAARLKRVDSKVAGEVDCLLMPSLETGNVFYKLAMVLGFAVSGSVLVGAKVPCILTSRADRVITKFYSIVLAVLMSK